VQAITLIVCITIFWWFPESPRDLIQSKKKKKKKKKKKHEKARNIIAKYMTNLRRCWPIDRQHHRRGLA
jgi:hypothetical protein